MIRREQRNNYKKTLHALRARDIVQRSALVPMDERDSQRVDRLFEIQVKLRGLGKSAAQPVRENTRKRTIRRRRLNWR